MIMRITWGKVRPGMWGKLETVYKDFAKDSKDTKGQLGRWLLSDPAQTDAACFLTLWESLDDFKNYDPPRSFYDEMIDCFVGPNPFVVTSCDVRGMEISALKQKLG